MSTTGPSVRTQPDKKNGRSPDVVVVPKQGGEFAGVSDLAGGSLIAAGAGTVEAQAAWLGDARLASIQRRAAAAQIGAKQGNQHLQRVVASVTQGASSVGGQLSSHSKHTPSNGPRAAGRGVAQPAAIDEPGTLELDSAPALAPGYGPSQPLGQNGSSDSTWVQRQKARPVQAVLDPELPSGPAAMVRSLPTPTPAPAQEEEKSDYFGSISGLRQAASSRIAVAVRDILRDIPGYDLLTLVVGRDPVTDEAIERTPTDVLRTALSIIPGGDAIFQNLDESGAVDRAFGWLSNQLIKLNLTWETIKGLFRRAWKALPITDLVNPLGAWEKLRGIFLAPVIRLRNFVVSVGHKMLEFVFEGVMAKLDGGPVLALLQRAGGAFMQIVHNPIGFLSNLIGGVKQGLLNFVARVGDHLKTGLLSWLFGELAATGVEMPAEFNMRGLMGLVMQVLGLTWQSIRTRAAKAFGERVVGVLERSFELFTIIREQGPGGLWDHVQKELGDLKETVLGGIQEMVVTQVIQAGVQWIVSLLGGPAGAVVKAITMIRDLVMWFVNTGSRVFALVNAIADSLGAIASGSIGVAAKAVEETLGRMVPVAISFLASLLGLGDVGKKVMGIIQKVRGRIDKMVDAVILKAKAVAGKVMGMIRIGKEKKEVGAADQGEEDVKGIVERDLATRIKGPVASPGELRSIVTAVHNEHRKEGLKSLEIVAVPNQPGVFAIEASASPTKRVHVFRVSDLELTFPKTSLLATVNNTSIGKFTNQRNIHAEQWLVIHLRRYWADLIRKGIVKRHKTNELQILVTRSLCPNCNDELRDFSADFNVVLDLRMLSAYGEESVQMLAMMRQAGEHKVSVVSVQQVIKKLHPDEEMSPELEKNLQRKITQLQEMLASYEEIESK